MRSLILDGLDRRIIHALYLDGRAPFSRLAQVLGTSEQTIARRYRLLHDAGVVRVVGQLDSQRLGQSDWTARIRCVPSASMAVATALARRPDTSWVQLTSGGTEIFCTIRSRDDRQRTALLLEQLPAGPQIVALEAHCLLRLFVTSSVDAPGFAVVLTPEEVDRLRPPPVPTGRSGEGLRDDDWALVAALAEDGRATYRRLADRTHWHESTVRRRMEELVASGVLYFDLDVATDLLGIGTRAILWMEVAPAKLLEVGEALAHHPEVPFAAATTGSTNLLATIACRDDYAFFGYLTEKVAALEGVIRVETAPIVRSVKMHATMDAVVRRPGT